MSLLKFSAAAAALLVASPALAHPGPHDGHQPGGIFHWVTQPDHIAAAFVPAVLAIVVAVFLWRWLANSADLAESKRLAREPKRRLRRK
jgi:hydrogenase/urease accessory protein HupE